MHQKHKIPKYQKYSINFPVFFLHPCLDFNLTNEPIKNQQISDEPFDRFNLARPIVYRGGFSRDGSGSSNNEMNNDDELIFRNLDGFERTLVNALRLYNLGDELNRKRFYLERKMSNFNDHHHTPIGQQTTAQAQSKIQPNQEYSPESALNQHQLKRAIDPIGGANLLKRAVDRIGGGNLLKRR